MQDSPSVAARAAHCKCIETTRAAARGHPQSAALSGMERPFTDTYFPYISGRNLKAGKSSNPKPGVNLNPKILSGRPTSAWSQLWKVPIIQGL